MGFKGHKGKYVVKNKEKYVGDVNNITYRSSWVHFSHMEEHPI
jgi:hypothetical protein